MSGYTIPIAPGNSLRESGLSLAIHKAVLDGDSIVAQSVLDTVNGVQAALFAVKRKSDGAVFARLSEWMLESHDRLHITFRDEPEAFPPYRMATLEVLARLTPATEPESLAWRDRSRWALAEAGAFDLSAARSEQTSEHATTAVQENARGDSETRPASDQVGQAAAKPKASRLKLLIDRPPECKASQASGSIFLRFNGYALEGARGFVRLIAFQPVAEPLSRQITEAMSESGAAMLAVEGQFESKGGQRQFKISSALSAEPTQEQIPQRTKTDRPDGQEFGQESQSNSEPAAHQPQSR